MIERIEYQGVNNHIGGSSPRIKSLSVPLPYRGLDLPSRKIIFCQGGHIPAEMKFPVFSLSFPCVRYIFPMLFLHKK